MFTRKFAALALLFATSPFALGQPIFDADDDSVEDTVGVVGDVVEVRSGADGHLLYQLTGQPDESFGAGLNHNADLDGDGTFDIVVAAPSAAVNGTVVGRVAAYSGATGVGLWTRFGTAETRFGSQIATLGDQNYDGVPEIVVTAFELPLQAAVISGGDAAILRTTAHSVDAIAAFGEVGVVALAATDYDGSGIVDAADAVGFAMAYADNDPIADVNGDGVIDSEDIAIFTSDLSAGLTTIDAFLPEFGSSPASGGGTLTCVCQDPSGYDAITTSGDPYTDFWGCVESSVSVVCNNNALPELDGSVRMAFFASPQPGCVVLPNDSCVSITSQPEGSEGTVSIGDGSISLVPDEAGVYRVRYRLVYQCGDVVCAHCGECEFSVGVPPPPPPPPAACGARVCVDGPGTIFNSQDCPSPVTPPVRWVPFGETLWVHASVDPPEAGIVWSWGSAAGCENLVIESVETNTGSGHSSLMLRLSSAPEASCLVPIELWVLATAYESDCPIPTTAGCLIRIGADSDGDGLADEQEIDLAAGGDCPDPTNPDSDEDDFQDGTEVSLGSDPCDPNSVPNLSHDSDGDGVTDFEEAGYGTNPLAADSDDDGADDYGELRLMLARPEIGMSPLHATSVSSASSAGTLADGAISSWVIHDADRDGLFDELETKKGWRTTSPDQDFDGIRDGLEVRRGMSPEIADQGPGSPEPWVDTDGDGLVDTVERKLGTNSRSHDSDGDGVDDGNEAALGYDPDREDSDRNGTPDGEEDYDGDGATNEQEAANGTNAAVADSDGDGLCDSRDLNPTGRQMLSPVDLDGDGVLECGPVQLDFWLSCSAPPVKSWLQVGGQRVRAAQCNGNSGEPLQRIRPWIGIGQSIDVRWSIGCGGTSNVGTTGAMDFDECGRIVLVGHPSRCRGPNNSCCTEWVTHVWEWPEGLGPQSAGDSDGDGEPDTWDDDPTDGFQPERVPTTVDLDIDSDGNDGANEPAGTQAEEGLEDVAGHHGKIILADTWDSDGDNIPDNADGLEGSSPKLDHFPTVLDISRGGVNFIPMRLKVTGYFPKDAIVPGTVSFSYSYSDPTKVGTQANGSQATDPFAMPPGNFRLWTMFKPVRGADPWSGDGPVLADSTFPAAGSSSCGQSAGLTLLKGTPNDANGAPMLDALGELLPGEAVKLSDLGIGEFGGEVVVYVEAVRASPAMGMKISATVAGSQSEVGGSVGTDIVRATATAATWRTLNADGTIGESVRKPAAQHPTPKITVDASSLEINVAPAPGQPTHLNATIRLSAQIEDSVSDLIPDGTGMVTELGVRLNGDVIAAAGDPAASRTLPVVAQKASGPDPNDPLRLTRPYRYSGSVAVTDQLAAVPVQPGWNELELTAKNAYCLKGVSRVKFFVSATPPADIVAQFELHTLHLPPEGQEVEPIQLRIRTGPNLSTMSEWEEHWLDWTGIPYSYTSTALSMQMDPVTLNPLEIDYVVIQIGSPDVRFRERRLLLEETGPDSTVFIATIEILGEDEPDFGRGTISIPPDGVLPPDGTVGGPSIGTRTIGVLLQIEGPEGVFSGSYAKQLRLQNQSYDLVPIQGQPGRFIAPPGTSHPTVITPVPALPSQAPGGGGGGGSPNATPGSQQPIARYIREGDDEFDWELFFVGFGNGLWDTGVSFWDGAVELGKFLVALGGEAFAFQLDVLEIAILGDDGHEIAAEDYPAFQAAVKNFQGVLQVGEKLREGAVDQLAAVIANDEEKLAELSEEYRAYFDAGAELVDALGETLDNLREDQAGYICGRIIGEVGAEVVAASATGGASFALKSAERLAIVTNVMNKLDTPSKFAEFIHAGKIGVRFYDCEQMSARLPLALQWVARLITSNLCFEPGTPVLTPSGPVAIECLREGDEVVACDPDSGELNVRKVLKLIMTAPDRIATLDYVDGKGLNHRLRGTPEHPFYLPSTDSFVPMSALEPGDPLLLATGEAAMVRAMHIAPGRRDGLTYNIEVEGDHTYFVGTAPVLVHNAGPTCTSLLRIMLKRLDTLGVDDVGRRYWLSASVDSIKEIQDLIEARWRAKHPGAALPNPRPWHFHAATKAEILRGLNGEIINAASGDYRKMFTYDDWVEWFNRANMPSATDPLDPGWARSTIRHEVHHAAGKEDLTKIWNGLYPGSEMPNWDSVTPCIPLPIRRHNYSWAGGAQDSFHEILRQMKGLEANSILPTDSAVARAEKTRNAYRLAYQRMNERHGAADGIDYARLGDSVDAFWYDVINGDM